MARLTSTGIVFGDNTVINSKYGIVPQNSIALFIQSSAPVGWAKSTFHNDKTLRVVSGTGGGSGGSITFTSAFPNSVKTVSVPSVPVSGTVGNHTLSITELPSHSHSSASIGLSPGGGDVGSGAGWNRFFPAFGSDGAGGSHGHPWSGSFAFSASMDFRLQYVDVIICKFS